MTVPAPGTHIVYPRDNCRPRPAGGPLFEVWRLVAKLLLRLWGWRLKGDWPDLPKMVLICAPHTSNWDGIWMLCAAAHWRVRLRYMGKKSLTEGPFGGFVKWTGCIPVDRSKSNDLVAQMAREFATREELVLAIPPEGTRGKVEKWKSGFYHIARGAGVPLVMAVLDYGRKEVRVSGAIWPSGDYAADFALIRGHYEAAVGKHAGDFTLAI